MRANLGAKLWDQWLWLHARQVWEGLAPRLISSNHYLADLLGCWLSVRFSPVILPLECGCASGISSRAAGADARRRRAQRSLAAVLRGVPAIVQHFHRGGIRTCQPPFIVQAVRLHKPGILVIRRPIDSIVSWTIFWEGRIRLDHALDYYLDFHRPLLPYPAERASGQPFPALGSNQVRAVLAITGKTSRSDSLSS